MIFDLAERPGQWGYRATYKPQEQHAPWITAAAHKPKKWHVDGQAQLPTSPGSALFFCFEKQGRGHRQAYLSLRFKIGSPSCLATLKMT
jgi:hypothetical protein